jgi:hypothetical protein
MGHSYVRGVGRWGKWYIYTILSNTSQRQLNDRPPSEIAESFSRAIDFVGVGSKLLRDAD